MLKLNFTSILYYLLPDNVAKLSLYVFGAANTNIHLYYSERLLDNTELTESQ